MGSFDNWTRGLPLAREGLDDAQGGLSLYSVDLSLRPGYYEVRPGLVAIAPRLLSSLPVLKMCVSLSHGAPAMHSRTTLTASESSSLCTPLRLFR